MDDVKRAACFLSTLVLWAQPSPDNGEILAKARERLSSTLHGLPRYTCVETIDRSYLKRIAPVRQGSCDQIAADKHTGATKLQVTATDRVRLDVAIAGSGRELYSGAGARRFESERGADLVGGGAFGMGSFGAFLLDIFCNSGVLFSHDDKLVSASLPVAGLLEYRFRVPLKYSHYRIDGTASDYRFPYDGAFFVAPDSADLRRLRVRTSQLPDSTGTC